MGQDVAEPRAGAMDLVRIRRSDAATCGPDLRIEAVEDPMVREDDVGSVGDEEPGAEGGISALIRPGVQFPLEHPRVDHHAIAEYEGRFGIGDPRWEQVELDRAIADDHRVASIVAALEADDPTEGRGQLINELPLPSSPHWAPRTTVAGMVGPTTAAP